MFENKTHDKTVFSDSDFFFFEKKRCDKKDLKLNFCLSYACK